MSSQFPVDGRDAPNVHEFTNNHASDIRLDLAALRNSVTLAWQERGIMLTPDERKELKCSASFSGSPPIRSDRRAFSSSRFILEPNVCQGEQWRRR